VTANNLVNNSVHPILPRYKDIVGFLLLRTAILPYLYFSQIWRVPWGLHRRRSGSEER